MILDTLCDVKLREGVVTGKQMIAAYLRFIFAANM